MESQELSRTVTLPRVAITYCTQCKWLLRAAYFGQELLSTFGTSIGEVALIPATGGIFTVYLSYKPLGAEDAEVQQVLLWDRKAEGGFPETKTLKQRVRNIIEPEKKLGHSDTPSAKERKATATETEKVPTSSQGVDGASAATNAQGDPLVLEATMAQQQCEDCK